MTKETKRKDYSTQQAQNEANKRYYHASEENRQRRLYIQAKSTAKNFILNGGYVTATKKRLASWGTVRAFC